MYVDDEEYPDPDTPTFCSDPDSNGSGKRFRLNEGGFSTPNSGDDEEGMGRQRPLGIKAAKKKKGKMKVGEVAYLAESIDRLGNRFADKKTDDEELQRERKIYQDKKMEIRAQQLAVAQQKIQLDEKIYKWNAYQSLQSRNDLTPSEKQWKLSLLHDLKNN